MGYLVLGIILVVIFFATIRFVSRWLYNKGRFGFFLHNLISLIGTIIMIVLSFVIQGMEDVDSVLGGAIIYVIVTFFTFFWFFSSSEDRYVTTEKTEGHGTIDLNTGTGNITTTTEKDTVNDNSLVRVFFRALILAAVWAVVTYFLVETGFAWIPSAIAVLVTAYLTIISFRSYSRSKK